MLEERALAALRTLLSPDQVFTDATALIAYEGDGGLDRGRPDAVVFPRSTEEVVRLVHWANEYGVPLIARGAGTGLSGGAVADRGGVQVAFSQMQAILEVDPLGRRALVQPAVINLALDEQVKAYDLYFPPDPSSQRVSTLGGNVAENSGGPHCFKYGVMTNYLTSLEVVLADGRRLLLGGPACDYPLSDLCGLLCGSEGTLALITTIGVRLVRRPPGVQTLLATFDSVERAGQAVSAIIAAGLIPATMEMMDQQIIQMIEPFAHAGLPLEAGAALIVEVDGYPASLAGQMEEISRLLLAYGGRDLRLARDEEERARIWLARKSAAGAATRLAPAYYTVDITVPRSRLAEMLQRVNAICQRYGLRTGHVFHAGDGNLHPMLLIPNPDDASLLERVREAGREIVRACVAFNGSLTGEHGVGIEKREFMSLMHSPAELSAMWDVKQVFDPQNLLNPGKIFPQHEAHPWVERPAPTAGPSEADPVPLQPGELLAPASDEEAAQLLARCTARNWPVLLMGGEESAQAPPPPSAGAALLLSTRRLRGIREDAPDDLFITVGAGTPLAEIQDWLGRRRQQVALSSPWPEATLGGLVAANVNGPRRLRYGALREQVLSLTVALADGRLIRTGRPLTKNVAGYDLTKAFIGSYGTLGLLTSVTLKCWPQPRRRRSLLVPVEDLRHGLLWARQLLPLTLVASALLLCRGSQLARRYSPRLHAAPYLLVYTAEGLATDVESELEEVTSALQRAQAPEPVTCEELSGDDLWCELLRGEGESGLSAGGRSTAHEAAPVVVRLGLAARDLPRWLIDQQQLLEGCDLVADVATGLLYVVTPWTTTRTTTLLEQLQAAVPTDEGYVTVMDQPRPSPSFAFFGPASPSLELMLHLKERWDPQGILNRGLLLPSPG
ncbi:FAD-binding oxidoreductase [Thermogemmatispora carboxidivorans]|uniref:FAD-binding oxidoreductase n=1 Tax=Thermogemmatispora carboxidivorans TaxID=1382306 RepID=UPI000699947B|nr:FAD-binding oxidoreductase [Thermogemmatispora carboxidivorans]